MTMSSAMERRSPRSITVVIGAALALAVIATVLLYWPGVHGGFTMDDFSNIADNPAVHITQLKPKTILAAAFSSPAGPLDRPISMVSFALNEYFWGPSPYSMKITNIAIHASNGLLAYVVLALVMSAYRKRFRPELTRSGLAWVAVGATTAWLLLPINLTAVLYVVQRMTSLSGTFVLAGIAIYLWGRLRMLAGQSGLWMVWGGITIFGCLAVLTKEIGALLPVYTLVIEWILFDFRGANGRRDRRLYVLYALVLVLPGVLGLIWIAPAQLTGNAYKARPFSLGERLLTEPRVVIDYIIWSLLPNPRSLSLYHDDFPLSRSLIDPPSTLVALTLIAILLTIAFRQRNRRPLVALGILWFFVGQLLTATIFPLELVYEHRNYLPSIGLLLAAFSYLLLESPERRLAMLRRSLVIGLIALYAGITALRVQQWSNPLRYAAISAAEHPNSPRATYALGRIYATMVDGSDSRYLPLANEALEKAAGIPNSNILPDQGLLLINSKQHKALKRAWWNSMVHKLASHPASAQDVNALDALVYCELLDECEFPETEMNRVFAIALTRNPQNPDIVAIYSNYVLNIRHEPDKARTLMLKTIRMAPNISQYWINLIKLDIFLHRFNDAHEEILHLSTLNHFGRLDDAIDRMKRRLAKTLATLQPDSAKLDSQSTVPPSVRAKSGPYRSGATP